MLGEQDPSRPQGNRNAGGRWVKSAMRNLGSPSVDYSAWGFCPFVFDILFNARVVAQSAHDALSGWRLGSCLLLDSFDVTSVLLTRFSLLIDKGFYDAVWEEKKNREKGRRWTRTMGIRIFFANFVDLSLVAFGSLTRPCFAIFLLSHRLSWVIQLVGAVSLASINRRGLYMCVFVFDKLCFLFLWGGGDVVGCYCRWMCCWTGNSFFMCIVDVVYMDLLFHFLHWLFWGRS